MINLLALLATSRLIYRLDAFPQAALLLQTLAIGHSFPW
jgi:hypothetical protein